MRAVLHRKYTNDATYGQLDVGDITVFMLELPWRDNKNSISCIPEGIYKVERRVSPSQGLCYRLIGVPKRSQILIHSANYTRELRGCLSPGLSQKDIDKDGIIDNVSSRLALNKLLAVDITEIEIKS
jgi:hypothetical protein